MKFFLTTAIALSLIGGSTAIAQPQGNDHRGQANDGQGAAGHQWARGERLPSSYRTADHYVDYRANHLRRPAHGHRWVRTDNGSYAEVALTTGLIYSIANAR